MNTMTRTPAICQHPRANHQHGTRACYVHDRCRCLDCMNANTDYETMRSRKKAYGVVTHVPAGPARDHIRSLMDQGMGLRSIVATGAISGGGLTKLLYGKRDEHGVLHVTNRIEKARADAILALECTLADGARVPALGATRRLQALHALGWSQRLLSKALDVEPSTLTRLTHEMGGSITVATDRTIRSLYKRISMTPPPQDTSMEQASVARAKREAQLNGWAPPLAWDDEDLDDPKARPHGMRIPVIQISSQWLLEAQDLLDMGEHPLAIAQRIGKKPASISRSAYRYDFRQLGKAFAKVA